MLLQKVQRMMEHLSQRVGKQRACALGVCPENVRLLGVDTRHRTDQSEASKWSRDKNQPIGIENGYGQLQHILLRQDNKTCHEPLPYFVQYPGYQVLQHYCTAARLQRFVMHHKHQNCSDVLEELCNWV